MSNDMVSDLDDFPGAPFTDAQIDGAVAALRSAVRWHIAPVRSETVVLDVQRWERWLRLPTRHLVSVVEIRNAETGDVIDSDTYRVSTRLDMVKSSSGYWPCGYGAVEIDITHGYSTTPADVLAVLAAAAALGRQDATVRQVSVDDFTTIRNNDAVQAMVLASLDSSYFLTESLYGLGIA